MIENAISKADEAFSGLEQSDLAKMSGKIMDNFNKKLKDLDNKASEIYGKVTNTIPKKRYKATNNNSKRYSSILEISCFIFLI